MDPSAAELQTADDSDYIEVSYERAERLDDSGVIFTDGRDNYYTTNNSQATNCCNCDQHV